MGKNLKYGEFTFAPSPARPSSRPVSTAKSTKGIPKTMYDAPRPMKDGGMCKSTVGYAKGGPKMPARAMKREPEAMVRKEVALLRKAGAPKAIIEHEVREAKSPIAMKKGGITKMQQKVGKVMSEFKAGELHSGSKEGPIVKNPKQAIAIGLSEGRKARGYAEGGQYAAEAPKKMAAEGKAVNKLAKNFGTKSQKYAEGGSVEAKLEKHADMPASKAHGPGAGNKLAKGGVPSFSKVPKFGRMK
jgi:hypothetical protein